MSTKSASVGRTFGGVVILGLGIAGLWIGWDGLTDTNRAGYVKIRQMPITGELSVRSEPGMYGRWFGEVTEYKQAGTYSFADRPVEVASAKSGTVEVRFNDGGIASLSGNARFDLPLQIDEMIEIHTKFRSYTHIARTLIQPAVAEALILTASLMSAEESYSGRRSEFSQLALDQVLNGVYITEWEERESLDPITGDTRLRRVVHIKLDSEGAPIRRPNPLQEYNIRVSQFFLDKDFGYEEGVLQQISNQRDSYMKTVAARAEAEKAQQDRLTSEAQGQANVMSAKYEAEVTKERAVVAARQHKEVAETLANQRLEVARLDRQSAEEYKLMKILQAEGDSEYKRRVMQADGALEQKLTAWVDVNKRYAEAIQGYQGAWVPRVVMGPRENGGGMGANELVNLLVAKTANELSLDVSLPTGSGKR